MNTFIHLLQVVARLRDPDSGCPWDLQQTPQSLCRYILEEAYETVEAIESRDRDAIVDELGDLLFQVVLQSQIAAEADDFNLNDVAAAIAQKLERRHPHVFGDEQVRDAEHQRERWEQFKQKERKQLRNHTATTSVLDGVSGTLPATSQAIKLQQRAASIGFDWKSIAPIFDKVLEELDEVRVEVTAQDQDAIEDEIGDLFFAVTNLARHAGVDPETSLRRSNRKFTRRFQALEKQLQTQGLDITSASQDELERLWQLVKQELAGAPRD